MSVRTKELDSIVTSVPEVGRRLDSFCVKRNSSMNGRQHMESFV